jgi:SPP1 family predicted phage head-tail adaptor
MSYDKPITIQKQDTETEEWTDLWKLHAEVNKTGGGQTFSAGADQYKATLTFKLRYFAALEAMRYSPQLYRISYRGHTFKLADYDDFMEQHQEVKLVGEAYG